TLIIVLTQSSKVTLQRKDRIRCPFHSIRATVIMVLSWRVKKIRAYLNDKRDVVQALSGY
ncbi:hypothetical protein, partial [Escherichia coli]|uniref:hypothetical protein n=1 Tax=Escherichia coli TaxID=562 RepID=UPI0032190F8A